MNILAEDTVLKYYLIEEAYEVDYFEISNFDFFKFYGVNDYRETFKIWLRKFPRPLFIAGVMENRIISFMYLEIWEEELPEIVNVLRAQETYEKWREKKIGYKIFLLGLFLTTGYIFTKPLTKKSAEFYKSVGFVEFNELSIFSNFKRLSGYLVLPLAKREEHLSKIKEYFTKFYL